MFFFELLGNGGARTAAADPQRFYYAFSASSITGEAYKCDSQIPQQLDKFLTQCFTKFRSSSSLLMPETCNTNFRQVVSQS